MDKVWFIIFTGIMQSMNQLFKYLLLPDLGQYAYHDYYSHQ